MNLNGFFIRRGETFAIECSFGLIRVSCGNEIKLLALWCQNQRQYSFPTSADDFQSVFGGGLGYPLVIVKHCFDVSGDYIMLPDMLSVALVP